LRNTSRLDKGFKPLVRIAQLRKSYLIDTVLVPEGFVEQYCGAG